ncbi:MAG: lipid-A-disaccharide synthase [Rhodospirillaceae bacterium]|nr:MAG: lipid-A-disaccharide synthase [Rhodospirillaceae bacterium]
MTGGHGPDAGPLFFIIAGEPSGDLLGARLMAALRERLGKGVRFYGIGGEGMLREGLEALFPMRDIALIGIAEILPHLPLLLRRIRETVAAIKTARPVSLITIDTPTFSYQVARRLKGSGIPVVHYVAPQVWAWKPRRAKKLARVNDLLLTLLPFEPPIFKKEGLPSIAVGHSAIESGAGTGDGPYFRERHNIPPLSPVIAMLPGSRHSETSRLLPVFGDALALLRVRYPRLHAVVPTVSVVEEEVRTATANWPVPTIVIKNDDEKWDALSASEIAVVASGTATVEVARAGLPMVVTYQVNPVTAWLLRRMLRIPYVALVNVILNREVLPELLQENCNPKMLADSLIRLLQDPAARELQKRDVKEALLQLGEGDELPSRRAASAILEFLEKRAASS